MKERKIIKFLARPPVVLGIQEHAPPTHVINNYIYEWKSINFLKTINIKFGKTKRELKSYYTNEGI
jgi:hypothetical protein